MVASFHIRALKSDERFGTIQLRIHDEPYRYRFSTGIKVLCEHWTEKQRLKIPRSHPENQEVNNLLTKWDQQIVSLFHKVVSETGRGPSKNGYAAIIGSSGKDMTGVLQYIRKVFCHKRLSQGKLVSESSVKKFKTLAEHITIFEKKYGYQLTWGRVDGRLKADLDKYFFQDCELAANTANRYYKHLKQVIKHAHNEGLHTNTYFMHSDFVPPAESLVKVFVTEAELLKISGLMLGDNKRLREVRDAFLIGCWTGLRHSDWHKVNTKTVNGHVIRVIQQKTKMPVILPLAPEIEEVIARYGEEGVRMISNQKFNDYIKEVSVMAGIDDLFITSITRGGNLVTEQREKWELITSHTARRSFATNMYLRGYAPLEIMSATGHKTESEFLKYINVGELERAQQLAARMRV